LQEIISERRYFHHGEPVCHQSVGSPRPYLHSLDYATCCLVACNHVPYCPLSRKYVKKVFGFLNPIGTISCKEFKGSGTKVPCTQIVISLTRRVVLDEKKRQSETQR